MASRSRLQPIEESSPIPLRLARQLTAIFHQAVKSHIDQAGESTKIERPENLEPWARRFWGEGFSLPSSDMHRWLYAALDSCDSNRGQRIALTGPRSNSKSQLTTAYALRCAVEGREPYIWIVSDVDEQAEGNLDSIREQIEDNRLLGAAYPEAVGRGKRWRSGRLDLSNGCTIQAFGMMAKMRGRKKGSQRPSLIIGDDLQNDSIQTSGEQRQKQQRRFDDVIMNAGTRRTNVIVVGTSLHRECIVENLAKRPGWQFARFSSIRKWPHRMDLWEQWAAILRGSSKLITPAHADGASLLSGPTAAALNFFKSNREAMLEGFEVLWPEWESPYDLMLARESNGRSSFEREKQSNPINPETCFFPEEWFSDDVMFDEWPKQPRAWVGALDPSLGKSDHSDFSAYVWGCVDENQTIYVDADIQRRTVPTLIEDGITLWLNITPSVFFVEANQFQSLLLSLFHQRAKERGVIVSFKPIENHENKIVRIRRLETYLQNRRVRFRRTPGVMLLLEQLRQFPNALHDDGPDALEVFIRGLLGIQRRAA